MIIVGDSDPEVCRRYCRRLSTEVIVSLIVSYNAHEAMGISLGEGSVKQVKALV